MPGLPAQPSLKQLRHQARDRPGPARSSSWPGSASTSTPGAAPTCPARIRGRPRCTSRRWKGRLDLARTLLRLGADPGLRDQRFGSTPLGWARYFGQEQLIGLLEPVTAADAPAAGHGSAP